MWRFRRRSRSRCGNLNSLLFLSCQFLSAVGRVFWKQIVDTLWGHVRPWQQNPLEGLDTRKQKPHQMTKQTPNGMRWNEVSTAADTQVQ